MSVPTTKPRLSKIDPAALANAVQEQLVAHVQALVWHLQPGWQLMGAGDTQAGWTVQALAEYARTGRDAETEEPEIAASFAHDRIGDLLTLLYSRASDEQGRVNVDTMVGDADPDTEIGCVLAAAWARIRITMEERVPAIGVAALASIDVQHLRLLARQGEIELRDGEVLPAEARRWLSGRGIAS